MKIKALCLAGCVYSTTLLAAEEFHRDWMVNTDGAEYYFAATVNNSNDIFGKYCYFDSEKCLFLVGVDITCEKGFEYPALVNSEYAAIHVTLHCGDTFGSQNVMVLEPYDDIDLAILQGSQFGIAVPMESGKFQVSRFSLSGAADAIESMMDAAIRHLNKKRTLPENEQL
ncbi:hypothetical protein CS022_13730 [Veronia nyctiphanis]|uniref:Uncharacterized protein n=1 Tax=Veronia nyctiphanis TaxID=1278244 RepID=A0A4Q0YP52_9GAMM|nr:hypothetical protein [Veronia nyctiphanis]RXJ72696.1 hypothetical protein CS022_13730 [Veronia nyctiphanis]